MTLKSLTELSPELTDQLLRVEENIARNEAEDPEAFTYACSCCQDTGYVVTDEVHPRFGTLAVGRGCFDCSAGLAIIERSSKRRQERAERAATWRKTHNPNRRLRDVTPSE